MSADTVRMANQIARAFAADPRKVEEVAAMVVVVAATEVVTIATAVNSG